MIGSMNGISPELTENPLCDLSPAQHRLADRVRLGSHPVQGVLWRAAKSGDTDVVAIDVPTLSVQRVGTFGGQRWPLHVSPDDSVLSFNKDSRTGSPLGTGRISWIIGTDPPSESPQTQSFATDRSEDGQWYVDTNTERIMPMSGEGPRLAVDRNVPRNSSFIPASIRFTPDSFWVIYRGRDAEGKDGVGVPMSIIGAKERLGDHPQVGTNAGHGCGSARTAARSWLSSSRHSRTEIGSPEKGIGPRSDSSSQGGTFGTACPNRVNFTLKWYTKLRLGDGCCPA